MEFCENSVLVRKLRGNMKRVLLPKFPENTELFVECIFVLLPDTVNMIEFTSAVAIHIPLQKNML